MTYLRDKSMRINKELKLIIALLLVSSSVIAGGMTLLYVEDFEDFENNPTFDLNINTLGSTALGYNKWVVNSDYLGGTGSFNCDTPFLYNYTVGAFPMQPNGITNAPFSNYLHTVSNVAEDDNVLSSSYLAASQPPNCTLPSERYFAAMNMDISTINQQNVTLSFWWRNIGGEANNNLDNAFGQIYYSYNSGSHWQLLTTPQTQYLGQSDWIQEVISLPEWSNRPRLRFGVRFTNAVATAASDTGFGFDEISISGEFSDLIFENGFETDTP